MQLLRRWRYTRPDGEWQNQTLADIRVGDAIYGTIRDGAYRRYVATNVIDHWSTMKPAYRVTLEDGTELVTSGDHRFLSDRGWKHVTGSEHGPDRRPHLTPNNELMGTGRFAAPPRGGPDYQRGYLCGMIRGDGHLGSYASPRPGRAAVRPIDFAGPHGPRGDPQNPRLSGRARCPDGRVRVQGGGRTAPGHDRDPHLDTRRGGVDLEHHRLATIRIDEWCKGFLGGIFDAEGGHSGGILRICNTDPAIVDEITASLRRFGFAFAIENRLTINAKRLQSVRLLGGLREQLRFFTPSTAITGKRIIDGMAITGDAPLRVVAIEPLGVDLLSVRPHHRNRRFRSKRYDKSQLLRSTLPHLSELRRRAGLRAQDRGEGERARGAAAGAAAQELDRGARGDGDQHRPVPAV